MFCYVCLIVNVKKGFGFLVINVNLYSSLMIELYYFDYFVYMCMKN